MRSKKRARKELNLVFLDLAKAFDTVLHESVFGALARKGVPEEVIDVVRQMYQNTRTVISNGHEQTRSITIRSGVKQGCPLSPLLFNLVLDELIEKLEGKNCGASFCGLRVACMPFSDDLVLLSDSEATMNILLETARLFFDGKGLTINAKKCFSYRSLPVKDKVAMKIVTRIHRWWGTRANAEPIPSMTFVELAKYLGLRFRPNGEVAIPLDDYDKWRSNVKKSCLKPEQKIDILKSTIIGRMDYVLRLAGPRGSTLRKLDRANRIWAKKVLHLPMSTPNVFMHGKQGVGLCELAKEIPLRRRKAWETMMENQDAVARITAIDMEKDVFRDVRVGGVERTRNSEHLERERPIALGKLTNGKALETIYRSDVNRPWLWRTGNVASGVKMVALKGMANVSMNRLNLTRGLAVRCRKCKHATETNLHILNECRTNRDAICKRHNGVCDRVAKILRRRGFEVTQERTFLITETREHLKPDMVCHFGDDSYVLDVRVSYETSTLGLEAKATEKEEKYRPVARLIERDRGMTKRVKTLGLIVGSWGTFTKGTRKRWRAIGMTRLDLESVQMITVGWSGRIMRGHTRTQQHKP